MGINMKEKKKKIAIILLFLIFSGTFSSYQSASATEETWAEGAFRFITNPIDAMTRGIVGAITFWAATIAGVFIKVTQSLLDWVISPDFIGGSMTNNVFVSYGWTMIRDLANIILVLGLVVIGLGIILGLKEYEAKKTLPVLIAIAILINFTPVICGFIIDFSNVLMHYFLTGGLSPGLTNIVVENLSRMSSQDPVQALAVVSVYFVFGIVAAFTYVLYALLFAARYIFLWIFIMFSPIAFVSRVFPQSNYIKHFFPEFFYWDTWWERFLQWCVIGIYGGFFVWLANQLMGGLAANNLTSSPSGDLNAFGNLFGYVMPILLLLIGLFSVYETWQKGLNAIPGMKQVVDLGTKAAMVAVTAGAGLAAGAVAGGLVGETAAMEKAMIAGKGPARAAAETLWGGIKGAARGAATSGGREEGMRWARRGVEQIPLVGRAIGGPGTVDAEFEAKLSAARKKVEAIPDTPEGNKSIIKRSKLWEIRQADYFERLAEMETLAKRKELPDDLVKVHGAEYQKAGGNINIIIKAKPNMSVAFTNPAGQQMTIAEGMAKIEPNEFWKTVQKDALKNEEVVLNAALDEMKFVRATRNMKAEYKKIFKDTYLSSSPTPLTAKQQQIIKKRSKELSSRPEWQV